VLMARATRAVRLSHASAVSPLRRRICSRRRAIRCSARSSSCVGSGAARRSAASASSRRARAARGPGSGATATGGAGAA
jgi:hypothetical protein